MSKKEINEINNFQQTSLGMNIEDSNEEFQIDVVELFYYLLERIKWIIVVFVLGGAISFTATYFLVAPKYTATAKLYMVSASSESMVNLTDLNIGTSLSEDYAEVIQIRPIYEEVINNLGLTYDYAELKEMVSISVVGDTRILQIKVISTNPTEAAEIANELANIAEQQVPKLMDTSSPNVIEPAIVPSKISSPSYTRNTMSGAIASMLILIVIYTIIFAMDDTFKSSEDIEVMFGIMPLTVIPESDIGSLSETNEHNDEAEKSNKLLKRFGRRKK